MAPGNAEETTGEGAPTTVLTLSYTTSDSVIRLSTSDGSRLTVDKHTLSIFSPIFKTMFEDVEDSSERIMLVDPGAAWKIVLDVIYYQLDLSVVDLSDFQAALAICQKYDMPVVRGHILEELK